jgi:hypothetical protein
MNMVNSRQGTVTIHSWLDQQDPLRHSVTNQEYHEKDSDTKPTYYVTSSRAKDYRALTCRLLRTTRTTITVTTIVYRQDNKPL